LVNPLEKVDDLPVSFFGILKIPEAGGVEKITEFQSSFMAGLDVLLHRFPVDLGKDKPRSRPSDDIERKFTEEAVYRCPLHSIQEGNVPIGSNAQFHKRSE
jgi:hypothetical protein